jgi:sulfite reductase alpha subunit-like flavoprotein
MGDKKILTPQYAFSRPKDGSAKQYVQDVLAKQQDLIVRMLQTEKGSLYICGATKMGADVQALVKKVVGDDYYKTMEKEKRIIVELWSS